jgi:hypothetical protein
MDYGVPEARVFVAGEEVPTVPSVVVTSAREQPFDRAVVSIDRDWSGADDLVAGAALEVALGYRESALQTAFRGQVLRFEPGRCLDLVAQDRMAVVGAARLKAALRNMNLQEVLAWALEQAGVTSAQVGADAFQTRPAHCFAVRDERLVDLFRRLPQTWPVAAGWDLWMDLDDAGTVRFLPWAESARAIVEPQLDLEWGENIFDLVPTEGGGTGVVETYLAPWVLHSHRITITDKRLWGREVTARVERVVHRVSESDSGTRIEWTLLES